MRRGSLQRLMLLGGPLLVLVLCFQNCTRTQDFSSSSSASVNASTSAPGNGHGDSYDGKPIAYEFSDLAKQCLERTRFGKPLPNSQIFLYSSGSALLVRDNCKDIVPLPIPRNELTVSAAGLVTYKGITYNQHTPADMELLVAACPAGLTAIPNAARSNAIVLPLDLQGPSWGSLGGVDVSAEGSLASYPAFRITRTSTEDFRRLDQYPMLSPNTTYSFSLFARRGNVDLAAITFYDATYGETSLRVDVDLATGSSGPIQSLNLSNVSVSTRSFADGQFISVYFTTPGAVRGLDLGFAAASLQVGASIFATDVQLETVSSYCR